MRKKIKYILALIVTILTLILAYNLVNKEEKIYYKDYIVNLKNEHNSNFSQALNVVNDRLKNEDLSDYEKNINLLARQTYLFFEGDYEQFKKYFPEVESSLEKQKMYEELVYLYSIITNINKSENQYEKAYVYIFKSELLTTLIYNEKKNEENLSTLLAIKYLKSIMALNIGLQNEAEKVFKEAEELRKEYKGRERSDIYTHIANYHYKQGDYKKAKEYALDSIRVMDNLKQYELDVISMKMLLAHSYIKLDEIHKALVIVDELENIDLNNTNIVKNKVVLREKLVLYGDIYKYYNEIEKSIELIEKSYELSIESNDLIAKVDILNRLIYLNKEINNEKEVIHWYEEYLMLFEKERRLEKNQYLISRIIDSDTIKTQADITILELEKKNLIYTDIILIIFLIIITATSTRLVYLNRYDNLTKIYNRGYFNKLYSKYNKSKETYSLLMFDIDNFKKLNDIYGHDFGDIVLINISKCIKNMLKQDCKLFRYGGEEFVILIKNNDIGYSLELAENIRKRVEIMTWKENVTVTISMGVSYSEDSINDMLKKADENLYKSKNSGKNKVTYIKV